MTRIENESLFISDIIDTSLLDKSKFNLIVAGCGTGKSHFVLNNLLSRYPDVQPDEVMVVTSRALTCEQQAKIKGVNRLDWGMVDFWNGAPEFDGVMARGITVCFYGDIIQMIDGGAFPGHRPLEKIKILIFDECHCLFSDEFIRGMRGLRTWIADSLAIGDKVIIGLTATPRILYHNNSLGYWGVLINLMNEQPIYRYHAKKLLCTNFDTIPYLISTNKLPGRTMIMCVSVSDCFKLQARIPNAAILVSRNNNQYDADVMNPIRKYIEENESLPPSFLRRLPNGELEERPLDVLLCTSTAREGYNILPKSGVRNIVCCFADELHITQFAGRCRYNLDNIVVADTYIRLDNFCKSNYLTLRRGEFKDFMRDKKKCAWFNSLAHLFDGGDVFDVKRFVLGSDEVRFCDYINRRWLVPNGTPPEDIQRYEIWRKDDRDEIVRAAIDCKLFALYDRDVTFRRVIELISKTLGYTVSRGRRRVEGAQPTYYLIIGYDASRRTYKAQVEGVDD